MGRVFSMSPGATFILLTSPSYCWPTQKQNLSLVKLRFASFGSCCDWFYVLIFYGRFAFLFWVPSVWSFLWHRFIVFRGYFQFVLLLNCFIALVIVTYSRGICLRHKMKTFFLIPYLLPLVAVGSLQLEELSDQTGSQSNFTFHCLPETLILDGRNVSPHTKILLGNIFIANKFEGKVVLFCSFFSLFPPREQMEAGWAAAQKRLEVTEM